MTDVLYPLAPKLYFVLGENKGKIPYSNGLFIDTKQKILVDAGFGPSRRKVIMDRGPIDIIINTHFHLDHAYGDRFFPEADIWAHELDAMALRSKKVFCAYAGTNKIAEMYRKEEYPHGIEEKNVVRELKDGEILNFGDIVFQVVHTPGHTCGHISLFELNYKILFSGDIGLFNFGPWYGSNCSDIDAFIVSIDKLIALKPKVLVSGHSGIVTRQIAEGLKSFEQKIEQREQKLLKALRIPKTIEQLVELNLIYPSYSHPRELRFYEKIMLEKHLMRLAVQNKVVICYNEQLKPYYRLNIRSAIKFT